MWPEFLFLWKSKVTVKTFSDIFLYFFTVREKIQALSLFVFLQTLFWFFINVRNLVSLGKIGFTSKNLIFYEFLSWQSRIVLANPPEIKFLNIFPEVRWIFWAYYWLFSQGQSSLSRVEFHSSFALNFSSQALVQILFTDGLVFVHGEKLTKFDQLPKWYT